MNEQETQELIDAVADARVDLYNRFCAGLPNERLRVVQLATQLLFQSCTVLQAVYDGNAEIVRRHVVNLIYSDAAK